MIKVVNIRNKQPTAPLFGAGVDLQQSIEIALLRLQDLPITHGAPLSAPLHTSKAGASSHTRMDATLFPLSTACARAQLVTLWQKTPPPSNPHLSSFS